MSSSNSLAKQISADLCIKWGVTWITPLLVQVFIVFSLPVRRFIYAFIQQNIATLKWQKQKLLLLALKGNGLATSINNLRAATVIMLEPVNQFLQMLPLDTILKEIPSAPDFTQGSAPSTKGQTTTLQSLSKLSTDLAGIIGDIITFIPMHLPPMVVSMDPDFFQGINSFSDLEKKIDELEFKLARATALSTYADAGSAYIDNLIQKAQVYIDIIITLDTAGL